MRTKGLSFRLAAVLVLAVTQTAVVERASARGGGGGWGGHAMGGHVGGRFLGSGHFNHPQFGHRLRNNPFFVAPFGWGWDWPYAADYGGTPTPNATSIVAYPPPWSARARDDCRWNEDTFNVPSSAGGIRPIQVVSCR